MREIIVLYKMPVILTKDEDWMKQRKGHYVSDGQVILLPEDAVLINLPDLINSDK